MPHDHPHTHTHHQHGHDHHHHDVGHNHSHGPGHNHTPDHDHLHSHVHGQSDADHAEELQVLSSSFVEGFRKADDKASYLRLADIPFQKTGKDGLTMHLVDAKITTHWQIGTACPAFATRELAYLPFPGSMIEERETMTFTYVSMTERADIDLLSFIAERFGHTHTYDHLHHHHS
ncbi:hypothetical protein AUP42_05360 [Thalassospira lucentensis]|uniref:Uncharacterized protein n=1 Tax=Thalassospira lucentensis TaxID=168935 RepID=A0A154L4J1_9PROT|nr:MULTISPECIES: hypothetical protein [Thalassospira]KZB62373.1 hypothetical protein AUP42_05360 [Thalassospira lucentensis]